jgi:hypothetical protein
MSPVSSYFHAEDIWQEPVTTEPKRCNTNNNLRQQSLENGRKNIGI